MQAIKKALIILVAQLSSLLLFWQTPGVSLIAEGMDSTTSCPQIQLSIDNSTTQESSSIREFKKINSSSKERTKKILVLIIASDNHPAFIKLQEIWRSYMHRNPESIEAYFIKGDPNIQAENEIIGDTIFSKIQDSYKPGILKKTVLSMEFLLEKIKNFDYVLRTNLSSFYDFPNLLKFVKTLPGKNCYCARPLFPYHGDVTAEFINIPFGWGAGFILSPDLVEMLVHKKEEVFQQSDEIPDDVLIGAFFYRKHVNLIPAECYALTTRMDWLNNKDKLPKNVFHFRAKSHYVYRKLEDIYDDELYILSELLKKFYPS